MTAHPHAREPLLSATPFIVTLTILLFACWATLPDPHLLTEGARATACVWSLLPWALLVGVVALDRCGTADAGLHTLWIAALFLLLFLAGGSQVLIWANANWATAPPRHVEVEVLSLGHIDDSNDLAIEVAGLGDAAQTTLVVDTWKVLSPRDLRALRLTLREGRFGWVYIADVEALGE